METAWSQGASVLVQVAMGVSLAACAGLRAFLPLFVVGVAGRFEIIPLSRSFEWLAGWPALTVLGVAVVTELLADKVPAVDHLLDVLQTFVKPIAGAVLVAAMLTELTPLQSAVLGILVGGSVAGGVHVSKAKVRIASSATTAGLGNPPLSFVEDVVALVGSLASVLVPLVAVLLLALGLTLAWWLLHRLRKRYRRA